MSNGSLHVCPVCDMVNSHKPHCTYQAYTYTGDSPLSMQQGGTHYKQLPIQPIQFIHANKIPFIEANIIKYACRHQHKNGSDDIRKIIHYCELLLELQYGEKP